MNFTEIWQKYDFTEAELLSMNWQFPNNYILNLNYYWELDSSEAEVATVDQPLKVTLVSCTHLQIEFSPQIGLVANVTSAKNLGTIVGWRQVTPSSWIDNLGLSPENWLHLEFNIGKGNKIEAICRSLTVEVATEEMIKLLA